MATRKMKNTFDSPIRKPGIFTSFRLKSGTVFKTERINRWESVYNDGVETGKATQIYGNTGVETNQMLCELVKEFSKGIHDEGFLFADPVEESVTCTEILPRYFSMNILKDGQIIVGRNPNYFLNVVNAIIHTEFFQDFIVYSHNGYIVDENIKGVEARLNWIRCMTDTLNDPELIEDSYYNFRRCTEVSNVINTAIRQVEYKIMHFPEVIAINEKARLEEKKRKESLKAASLKNNEDVAKARAWPKSHG